MALANTTRPGVWVCAGAIAMVTLAAYLNTFQGEFIFDDGPAIVNNPTIRHLWPPPVQGLYKSSVSGRPVVNVTLAINYALGGLSVGGYHAANLAIHLAAALLLLGVVRRTLVGTGAYSPRSATILSAVVAALWAAHPLGTESVTYVVQRTESLMGMFCLLTLYCVIRGAGSPSARWWRAAAVASCLLAVGCKEVAAVVPVVVLLYDRAFLAGSFKLRFASPVGSVRCPGGDVGAAGLAGRLRARPGGLRWMGKQSDDLGVRATQPGIILHYLVLAFWPQGQCLDYDWAPARMVSKILPGVLAIAVLLGATIWAFWKRPRWGFVGAAFFVILAPTSSIIPIRDLAFEHRMYLPLAAVIARWCLRATVCGKKRRQDSPRQLPGHCGVPRPSLW